MKSQWNEKVSHTHLNVLDGTGMHFIAVTFIGTMLTFEYYIGSLRYELYDNMKREREIDFSQNVNDKLLLLFRLAHN